VEDYITSDAWDAALWWGGVAEVRRRRIQSTAAATEPQGAPRSESAEDIYPVTTALREAIRSAGGCQVVAREAIVDRTSLQRFMTHRSGLSLETIDRLAKHLGLRLVATKRRQRADRRSAAARNGQPEKAVQAQESVDERGNRVNDSRLSETTRTGPATRFGPKRRASRKVAHRR